MRLPLAILLAGCLSIALSAVACGDSSPNLGFTDGGGSAEGGGEGGSQDGTAPDGMSPDGAVPGEGGVITMVPCTTGGGQCTMPEACGRGAGIIGSSKYNCGGSRRVCCFASCGGKAETTECCNAAHTYAPRPLCQDGTFTCPTGFTSVPVGTCIADSGTPVDAAKPDAADASDAG